MIRYAVLTDGVALWNLLLPMHAEQALFSFSPEKFYKTLEQAIIEGRVLVAEKDKKLIGSFGWCVGPANYFSDDIVMTDMWLYVDPAHRTGTAALRLMRAMKADARERGVPLMGGAVGKKLNGARLFNKDPDFEKVGELFLMRH